MPNTDSNIHIESIKKNIYILFSGSALAKLIGFISIPVITRLYLPEHMGILAVYISVVALLIPLATFRYSVAIPLPKQDALALNLLMACLIFLFITTVLLVLVLFWFTDSVLAILSLTQIAAYWWLLPLNFFGVGLYEILSSWCTREKAFKEIARSNIWQSVSGAAIKIIFGFVGWKLIGLLLGQLASQTSGILSLSKVLQIKFQFSQIKRERIFFLIKRYGDMPRYRLPSQVLLAFSIQFPLLASAYLFGIEITGQLGLALMATTMPISLFGYTIGQAYYAEISKIGRKQPHKIYLLTKNILKKLSLFSLLPFLILFFFGSSLFGFVFGSNWTQAGAFSSILSFYLLAQFVSSPLVNALNVFDKQKLFFRINIIRALIVLGIFCGSYYFQLTVSQTLYTYSLALSLHYLSVTYNIFKVINGKAH